MPWRHEMGPQGYLRWVDRPLTQAERAAEAARVAASKQHRVEVSARARRRRGLIYALRSSGATTAEIARALDVSWPRVRQIEAEINRAIRYAADQRFPLPRWYDWEAYAKARWIDWRAHARPPGA